MKQTTLASIYTETLATLNTASMTVSSVDTIWNKLYRVRKYLQAQAAIELAATLAE